MNATAWLQQYSAFVSTCAYVFLDIGSNRGMHSKFLYDASARWPDSPYATRLFPAFFGAHRNETCSVLFEPNPVHAARQHHLQQVWRRAGRRSMFAPFAVSGGSGGEVHFDPQLGNTRYNSDGARIVRGGGGGGIVVPCLSVRDILAPVKAATVVAMKVDIEGAEYSLFQTMLMTNLICTAVDHVTTEVHPRVADERIVSSRAEAEGFIDFLRLLSSWVGESSGCRLKTLQFTDDESYSSSID